MEGARSSPSSVQNSPFIFRTGHLPGFHTDLTIQSAANHGSVCKEFKTAVSLPPR